ncbi:MAG TPA: MATE family efflux transporter [Clostridiales bacterium]|nr:MATE family efflux transporter [Clostridiales bacterium]
MINFSLPFLLANLLQTLYGIVDMLVVGRFSDAAAMAAVSIGSLLMATINLAIIGLTTGGTVLIGQYWGAKRQDDARDTVSTMFTLYWIISLGIMALMLLLIGPILRLMNTPRESFLGALHYTQICLAGLIFTTGYNALACMLRGMGDSKNPLLFVAIACLCNIIGDIILVAGFGMGAEGAAIATTVSQGISMVLGIIYLKRKQFFFDFKPRSFTLKKDKSIELLEVGIPIALQEGLVMLSFIFLEAIINKMGYIATAAAGVADRAFMVAVIPSTAFSAAIASMVAQNIGAGLIERVRKCLRIGLVISFSIGVLMFIIVALVPGAVISLFTPDRDVIATAVEYLRSYKYEFLLCSLVFCMGGFINGTGHTKFTLYNNIISTFAVRVPLVYIFSRIAGATLFHIGIALPAASAVQLVAAVLYIRFGRWSSSIIEKSSAKLEV